MPGREGAGQGALDDRGGFRTPSPRQWGPWRVLTCLPEGGAERRRQEAAGLWEQGVAKGLEQSHRDTEGEPWGKEIRGARDQQALLGRSHREGWRTMPSLVSCTNLISLEASL